MNNAEFIIVNIVFAKKHLLTIYTQRLLYRHPFITARPITPVLCCWIELITMYLQCLQNTVQLRCKKPYIYIYISAAVQKLDSVNRRINCYPLDKYYKYYSI